MLLKKIRLLLLVTVFVAADSVNSLSAQATESITKLNQDRVCLIQDAYKAGATCKEGEIMLFIPNNPVGAGRTSIVLASLVCDFRFNISRDSEALTCVFTRKRQSQWKDFSML